MAPQILCYTAATEEELAEAAAHVRGHMAYYIGGMGSYYYNLFCRFGYRAEADKVREAWAERRRDQAAAAITDEMLENITVLGDASTCRAKLEQFRSQGADMPVVAFPHGASSAAVRRTLEALAPRAANAPPEVQP